MSCHVPSGKTTKLGGCLDPHPYIWEAAQYFTRGRRTGAIVPQQFIGYVLFRAPSLSLSVVRAAIDSGVGLFWRRSGQVLTLTELGLQHLWSTYGKPTARNRNAHRHNATARYFAQHWGEIIPQCCAYLTRKLRLSAELGKIEDHVMSWVTRAIEKNYLEKFLDDQGDLPPSLVCLFMFRMAASDLRKDGRNPACRALHGALAPHEIQARKVDDVPWTQRVEVLGPGLGEDPLENIAGPSDHREIPEFDVERASEFISGLLSTRFHGIRLADVYDARARSLGVEQTAQLLSVKPSVVQGARVKIRSLFQAHRHEFQELGLAI